MPSRQLSPTASSPPLHHKNHHLVAPLAGSMAASFSILLLFTLCYCRQRTVPSSSDTNSKSPRRFSYSSLRRATSSFSPSLRLGQGGFGSVFRGTLKPDLQVAVKLMDSGSLQGEREFQNELFFGGKIDSKFVVSVIGFSSDPKRRRMLLVYELLANGSLQDCLLHRKCPELLDWKRRFSIALSIARGLEYLHHFCDPPIIHGDIKPSNILLDDNFDAKIGDFGLAKMKSMEVQSENPVKIGGNLGNEAAIEDNGFVIDERESTVSAGALNCFDRGVDQSPESCFVKVEETPESVATGVEFSPEAETVVSPRIVAAMASPAEMFGMSISEDNYDSVVSVAEMENGCDMKSREKKKTRSGKAWWGKQHSGENASGAGKNNVGGWIGNDGEERPKAGWSGNLSSTRIAGKKEEKKKSRRRLKWWVSLDDDKDVRRPAREWWREEYSEELARKKKKKDKKEQETISDGGHRDNWWYRDNELYIDQKKKSRSRRSSWSSMDWWSDGLSGDLWRARRNSCDSASGEMPKSGGFSSTPSMRGTVCYVAPEYRIRGDLSEKCDVYSFGVLLLVLIAGRRPLEVTGSPMEDFQRANLLSWARHLARAGRLLDLVDQTIHSLDKEQALLCITVALLCLQKSPASRPSMQEIVGILSGELDSPKLPPEFSVSSTPSRKPKKSRKKAY